MIDINTTLLKTITKEVYFWYRNQTSESYKKFFYQRFNTDKTFADCASTNEGEEVILTEEGALHIMIDYQVTTNVNNTSYPYIKLTNKLYMWLCQDLGVDEIRVDFTVANNASSIPNTYLNIERTSSLSLLSASTIVYRDNSTTPCTIGNSDCYKKLRTPSYTDIVDDAMALMFKDEATFYSSSPPNPAIITYHYQIPIKGSYLATGSTRTALWRYKIHTEMEIWR